MGLNSDKFWSAVFSAVVSAELQHGLPKHQGTGRLKREIVVNLLVEVVDIPYIPKPIERILIGWAADGVVFVLNKTLGRLWIKKVLSPESTAKGSKSARES